MGIRGLSIGAAALFLAACNSEAPVVEEVDAQLEEALPVMGPEQTILAFGDSLFAGYQVEQDEGYPERLEAVLRGRGINAQVMDAGVSGDTTAEGLARIAFVLDNAAVTPDLAIVELGGNDLLRGISPDQTRANLEGILKELANREIPTLLMGMRAPPNYGPEFQTAFDELYPDLAQQFDTALVPFFLESIYERRELIMDDQIHPTAEGIEVLVAATVDDVVAALPEAEEAQGEGS